MIREYYLHYINTEGPSKIHFIVIDYTTNAMAIMDFLEELDTVFDEPIHLCDIKTSHFGISKDGRVNFIDLDSIFAKSILGMYKWKYIDLNVL